MDPVVLISAILTTLLDVDPEPAPASSIYMALGCDHSLYESVSLSLATNGLVVKTSTTLALTDLGREKAKELQAIYDEAKAADQSV